MNTEFLQSVEWLRLQAATGKDVMPLKEGDFVANSIVHELPLIGKYLYVPRGPRVENAKFQMPNFKKNIQTLIDLAKEKKCRWIRIEPKTEATLETIKKSLSYKIVRAPHDMQPREVFSIDITGTEEELLAQMKPKTRYNIRLAEKRGVRVFETRGTDYQEAFLNLITATSNRKGITSHPRAYYEKFLSVLPETMCRLFVAEYQGSVIAANLVMFYGNTVTYLHGGTADIHREVMAPYLLQWEQIKVAKNEGYQCYDFGGVRSENATNSWSGITKFKLGFSPTTKTIHYPGAYDIILDSWRYLLYDGLRHLQSLKRFLS